MLKNQGFAPVVLNRPRVWRTYLGGRLLDGLSGAEHGEDGHFPEEWIMSVISARNPGREDIGDEGMAKLMDGTERTLKECIESDPRACLGASHVRRYGPNPGVLVKLIDAAERLTIQVHPDRETANRLFGASFGKTECWHILGGRVIDGERPSVYVGFKPGITREAWRDLFDRQDIPGMLDCLHRFDVKAGDTILIQGGVPHAIGAGCFMVEIQEPTDYTIRVERTTPSGFRVADAACHQGLDFEKMFDCFHYEGFDRETTREKWFLGSKTLSASDGSHVTRLVGYGDTPFFAMRRLNVCHRCEGFPVRFSALYVLRGNGVLTYPGGTLALRAPQQLFVPACCEDWSLVAGDEPLEILQFFGPKV